jgi:hypothetical protein
MRRRFVLATAICTGLIVVGCLAIGPRRQLTEADAELDPAIRVLLETPVAFGDRPHFLTGRDNRQSFRAALTALARKHGRDPEEYLAGKGLPQACAIRLGTGRDCPLVVVLRDASGFTGGSDTQYLLLLDSEGRLLDRLSCEISNRLTFPRFLAFRTDVLEAPEEDGAQLVIRYLPSEGGGVSGSWGHAITHAGKTYRYRWDQGRPDTVRSAEWEAKGLCRVAVEGGKLCVRFPRPEQAQGDAE